MTNSSSISTLSEFAARLRSVISSSDSSSVEPTSLNDADFNELALSLFSLQFSHNAPYRRFCESRRIEPLKVKHWQDIPAMPTAGFKELELTSLALKQRTQVFHSSGTTEQRPSRHFHSYESLSIYEASLAPWFHRHLLPEPAESLDSLCLFLTPSATQAPHSSLVHMFECLRAKFGSQHSQFTGFIGSNGTWGLDLDAAVGALRNAIADRRPVILCGTAFNFVHLLDHLIEMDLMLPLPSGSRVMETGGYKGRSRELPKTKLHALITERLGIPASHIVCEYGMSELSSQAYDGVAGNVNKRVFNFPPWVRKQIISPENGREVGEGETGLLRILDLANVWSVMALQTEDLAVRRGTGFELLGRAVSAEQRGCSLRSH